MKEVWLRRYPTPPTKGGKLRTGKPKNRGVAPIAAHGTTASSCVRRRDVTRHTKNKPAMKAWFKGGCK